MDLKKIHFRSISLNGSYFNNIFIISFLINYYLYVPKKWSFHHVYLVLLLYKILDKII